MGADIQQLATRTATQIRELEAFTAQVKEETQQQIQRGLLDKESTIENKLE